LLSPSRRHAVPDLTTPQDRPELPPKRPLGLRHCGHMPLPGPPPKPIEQRLREGNPAKRPLPEPVLIGGRPDESLEPPDDLPPDGRLAWNEVVPTLAEAGVLDRVDRLALEAMCAAWARAKQAQRLVASQGHFVRGSRGQLREHPSLRTEREATMLFLRYAEQFGLTPAARARLGLAELKRRTLKAEFDAALGLPNLKPIDVDVVGD
jgi:P27 family predicted phage terminase small subunit